MGSVGKLPLRGIAALAALLVAAAVVTGCGGEGRAEVPAGFTEYRGDTYSFAHPAGWRRKEGKDERGRPTLMFVGPRLPSGVVDGQVHVGRINGYENDLGVQVGQFRGLTVMHGYRLTADRPMKMDGAAEAHRFEATYEAQDGKGTRIPFKLLGMYALTDDGVLVEFMLRSPRQGSAHSRLPVIFDSFRLND